MGCLGSFAVLVGLDIRGNVCADGDELFVGVRTLNPIGISSNPMQIGSRVLAASRDRSLVIYLSRTTQPLAGVCTATALVIPCTR